MFFFVQVKSDTTALQSVIDDDVKLAEHGGVAAFATSPTTQETIVNNFHATLMSAVETMIAKLSIDLTANAAELAHAKSMDQPPVCAHPDEADKQDLVTTTINTIKVQHGDMTPVPVVHFNSEVKDTIASADLPNHAPNAVDPPSTANVHVSDKTPQQSESESILDDNDSQALDDLYTLALAALASKQRRMRLP